MSLPLAGAESNPDRVQNSYRKFKSKPARPQGRMKRSRSHDRLQRSPATNLASFRNFGDTNGGNGNETHKVDFDALLREFDSAEQQRLTKLRPVDGVGAKSVAHLDATQRGRVVDAELATGRWVPVSPEDSESDADERESTGSDRRPRQRLKRVRTPGGGNCFFNALSYALHGHFRTASQYRQRLYDHASRICFGVELRLLTDDLVEQYVSVASLARKNHPPDMTRRRLLNAWKISTEHPLDVDSLRFLLAFVAYLKTGVRHRTWCDYDVGSILASGALGVVVVPHVLFGTSLERYPIERPPAGIRRSGAVFHFVYYSRHFDALVPVDETSRLTATVVQSNRTSLEPNCAVARDAARSRELIPKLRLRYRDARSESEIDDCRPQIYAPKAAMPTSLRLTCTLTTDKRIAYVGTAVPCIPPSEVSVAYENVPAALRFYRFDLNSIECDGEMRYRVFHAELPRTMEGAALHEHGDLHEREDSQATIRACQLGFKRAGDAVRLNFLKRCSTIKNAGGRTPTKNEPWTVMFIVNGGISDEESTVLNAAMQRLECNEENDTVAATNHARGFVRSTEKKPRRVASSAPPISSSSSSFLSSVLVPPELPADDDGNCSTGTDE